MRSNTVSVRTQLFALQTQVEQLTDAMQSLEKRWLVGAEALHDTSIKDSQTLEASLLSP